MPVIVKLRPAPLATYRGGRRGLAATSPRATGKKLSVRSRASRRYLAFLARNERVVGARIRARIPGARIGRSLRIVFGGLALRVPRDQVAALRRTKGVVAVYRDELRTLQTDSSPAFIGATAAWRQLGGSRKAGQGAILSPTSTAASGPSTRRSPIRATSPARSRRAPDGALRTCDFGDNPLTPEVDVFACNRKLIGGQAFLETYNAGRRRRDLPG